MQGAALGAGNFLWALDGGALGAFGACHGITTLTMVNYQINYQKSII
jgi:hypothetical protein